MLLNFNDDTQDNDDEIIESNKGKICKGHVASSRIPNTIAGPPLLSTTTVTAGPPAAVLSVEGLLQLQMACVAQRSHGGDAGGDQPDDRGPGLYPNQCQGSGKLGKANIRR
ncbi:hypothetical protein Tco_0736838 [Tanacetum coccineum]